MESPERQSILSLSGVGGAIFTYWLVKTIYNFITAPGPPTNIPWVGYGKGWIASFRNWTALTKGKEWINAGYENYSKQDKVFAVPSTLGTQAEVVMPRSQMGWMFDQPDNILSTSEAHYDVLKGDYGFITPILLKDPYHEHVIHKSLVRNLNAILPELEEEVPHAVDEVYGRDTTQFKQIDILDSFMRMIPVLTNRMLVGKELCRDRGFLDAVLGFTVDVIRTFTVLTLLPQASHVIVGNLLGLASKYHYWLSSRWTVPLIRKRISDITKKDSGDPTYKDWKEPSDFITWSYRVASSEGRIDEMQPERIAKRIMPINFASIHTTSITAFETVVSVLSADPSVLELLREEAHRVLKEEGSWTKAALTKMVRLDSAIRESQRSTPLALTFAARKVVAKEGVTLPEGVHVKYGTMLSCPWTPIAMDPELHTGDPEAFDAFRYSRPKEEYDALSVEEKAKVDALKLKQSGLVTTSMQHLPFGHGRHAW
jgi:cytochrome P450